MDKKKLIEPEQDFPSFRVNLHGEKVGVKGMSQRLYLASHILPSVIINDEAKDYEFSKHANAVRIAFEYADEMIKQEKEYYMAYLQQDNN